MLQQVSMSSTSSSWKSSSSRWWWFSFSYRNATISLSLFNLVLVLLLLRHFSSSSSSDPSSTSDHLNSDQARQLRESQEIRRAMEPFKLIKRVRDIELKNEKLPVLHEELKQTTAVDLSNRLKDIHSVNDAANIKALEEWRKRKMERARQRELGRNGTATSQA